ncbi:MAG: hypothetical protein DYG89_12350 [Caldilinea sp. CFX5]|nr:hypothetical protein [Caldilinea sp. CFX5]
MIFFRRLLIFLLGLALLALPTLARDWGYNDWRWQTIASNYAPPEVPDLSFAATPMPTPTPLPVNDPSLTDDGELRRGSVVVDFAHFSFLNPGNLQPLADALADRGLGLRYWISQVDPMALESAAQFPDQSEDLATQLQDASALIVISPFFLWTPQEIAVAEHFVADGGRLLLVSDPDVLGDFPSLVNILAEPFGVVFNDDYLYDTSHNDGNFTFFFVEGADAEPLADATIAFYGGRSISGAVIPQMRSAASTLSSLRAGKNGFTTVAVGGIAGHGTAGRVLALSDFDVLTEAYRVRYDNQRMVEFVADFLSGDQRNNTMPDFPNYLGKAVALSYGTQTAIGADLLAQGAQLQKRLEESGRTLTLTNGHALTARDGKDLIYLADYTTVFSTTTLLTDLGLQVITEAVTVTIPVEVAPVAESTEETPAEPAATDDTVEESAPITDTAAVTTTTTVTVTRTVTRPRPAPAAEAAETLTVTAAITASDVMTTSEPKVSVQITTYLVTAEGLRFLADETVLVAQHKRDDESLLLAVLGADRRGIDAGVVRLLSNDFSDCVIGEKLTFCSLPPGDSTSGDNGSSDAGKSDEGSGSEADDTGNGNEGDGSGGSKPSPAPNERTGILLIDDNRAAADGESSEADFYLQTLMGAEHSVDLWSTKGQGSPTADDLANYAWVIWSNAGYAEGKVTLEDMDLIFGYIRQGGRLTVSSRYPLPGLEEASTVRDVVVDSGLTALTDGLPDEPMTLTEEQTAADLSPLAADESGVQIALRRGPESDKAEAPLVAVLTDAAAEDSNARFMIVGFAVTGLPEEAGTTLINR